MFLLILVISLLVLTSFSLVGLVLLQNPKDEAGYHNVNMGGMQQLVGIASVPDLLERLTQVFFIAVFALTIATSFLLYERHEATKFVAPDLEQVR